MLKLNRLPKVFVGSSKDSLKYALAIQKSIEEVSECTVWDQGIFDLTKSTLESLLDTARHYDFGIFVLSSDDVSFINGKEVSSARDNVVLELGIFLGALGPDRTFIVYGPEGAAPQKGAGRPFRIPTDLLGITAGIFKNREDMNWRAALGPVCGEIQEKIKKSE